MGFGFETLDSLLFAAYSTPASLRNIEIACRASPWISGRDFSPNSWQTNSSLLSARSAIAPSPHSGRKLK